MQNKALPKKPKKIPYKPLSKNNKKRKPNSLYLESESQTVRIDAAIFHNQEGGELVLTNFAQF